jgi:hypothetical protein
LSDLRRDRMNRVSIVAGRLPPRRSASHAPGSRRPTRRRRARSSSCAARTNARPDPRRGRGWGATTRARRCRRPSCRSAWTKPRARRWRTARRRRALVGRSVAATASRLERSVTARGHDEGTARRMANQHVECRRRAPRCVVKPRADPCPRRHSRRCRRASAPRASPRSPTSAEANPRPGENCSRPAPQDARRVAHDAPDPRPAPAA